MLDTILFDLDGTLLPLSDTAFLELYMGLLGQRFARLGYDPKAFVQAVWAGTKAMIANEGRQSNEAVFREAFSKLVDTRGDLVYAEFERFYREDFPGVKASAKASPVSRQIVETLKAKGYTLALATNPLFPREATRQRIAWAGLDESDFALVTTYENSRFAKPNPLYYQEVLDKLGKTPEQCLMVGNDRHEDAAATKLGIPFFLVTDCLINERNLALDTLEKGTLEDFFVKIRSLPDRS